MRKTSTYSRKRRNQVQKDLWLTKIKDNKPYSDESLFGEEATIERANRSLSLVKSAFSRVDNRVSPADKQEDFELLAHAVTVAQIRTYDIGGEGSWEVMVRLNNAIAALDRLAVYWKTHKTWAVPGSDAEILQDAIDIYEQILLSSTPYEMEQAQTTRLDWLNKSQAKRKGK
jgi:hypothetical protein